MNEPIPNYDKKYCTPPETSHKLEMYEVDILVSVKLHALDEEQAARIAKDMLENSCYNVIEIQNVELL